LERVAPSVLAKELGLINSTTTAWSKCTTSILDTLPKISDKFGVTVSRTLTDDTEAEDGHKNRSHDELNCGRWDGCHIL